MRDATAGWHDVLRIFVPATAILFSVALLAFGTDMTFAELSRDPAAVARQHPLTGVLSNLGVLGWCAAATTGALALMVLDGPGNAESRRFFLFGALFTSLLMFDDLLMLHEEILRRLGIAQHLTLGAYAALCVAFFYRFRRQIRGRAVPVLALSLLFFALSVGVDALPRGTIPHHHLFEDGFKFLGIAGWLGFFVCSFRQAMRDGPPPGRLESIRGD